MMAKTNIGILILFLIAPFLALLLVGFLLIGEMKWTFLLLGLLPLVLILLGLYGRVSGAAQRWQNFFEIERHMTETERKQYNKLSLSFGLKAGALIGLCDMLASIFFSDQLAWYLTGLISSLLIMIPFMVRQQKAMTRFLLSTEYARKQELKTI